MSKNIVMSDKDVSRFKAKVGPLGPDGCQRWAASCNSTGYGQFYLGGTMTYAHRIAYFLATGSQPGGLEVLHECDNPPCINPSHLSLGTHRDNMEDAARKGRTARGMRLPYTKLSCKDVRAISSAYRNGRTQKDVAREFGVSRACVSFIVNGKRRQSVTTFDNAQGRA